MAEDALTRDSAAQAAVIGGSQPASSHRLRTVSASQILLNAATNTRTARLSTSLPSLDALLGTGNIKKPSQDNCGGFARGTVNEIWGPPGAGTTAFALQVAHNALEKYQSVIWIDSSLATPQSRFSHLPPGLHRFTAPTLAHLLSLIHQSSQPPPWLPFSTSSLLVLSDIHSLVDATYPRYTPSNLPEPARWAATRRAGVLGSLIGSLKRLAAVHDLAVLLTTGCATQTRPETVGAGAVLVPGIAVGAAAWDRGIATRLVLFRDFGPSVGPGRAEGVRGARGAARYVGVQKLNGARVARQDGVGHVVRFAVGRDGRLHEATALGAAAGALSAAVVPLAADRPKHVLGKRPFGQVADSEGEDGDEGDVDGAFAWTERDIDVLPGDLSDGETPVTGNGTTQVAVE